MSLPSSRIRKKHSKEFKFQVALEAVKEEKTIATICREFSIHDSQVNLWKRKLKEGGEKRKNRKGRKRTQRT
jgi:transposase-like protein